jgi:RNA polymerase sigma factor (sigma-70 family)
LSTVVEVFVEHLPESMRDGGDESLFSEMYHRSYAPLVAYCRRFAPAGIDAEDVAQEAFAHAWSSWDRYSPSRPFWPWVTTIARRLCIDGWRKTERAIARQAEIIDISELREVSPEELAEAAEEGHFALRAFRTLRPEHQRLVDLRDIEGWSYEDIARFEGVTVESVRGSLRRARVALRSAYERLATAAPVVMFTAKLRNLHRRAENAALRFQALTMPIGLGFERAGDALAGVVAVALVVAGGPASGTHRAAPIGRTAPVTPEAAAPATVPAAAPTAVTPPSATHKPTAAPAGAALLPVDPPVVLPQDAPATPESTTFDEITPSPHYESDHTVFALGHSTARCSSGGCRVLFRSADGGASWNRLAADNLSGEHLMLPPAWPTDSRIFAAGSLGLQASSDSGATFTTLTPVAGATAMSPGFSTGDPRILMGGAAAWAWRDLGSTAAGSQVRGILEPLALVLPPLALAPTFAFSPSYPSDPRFFVGTIMPGPDGVNTSAVALCHDATCGAPVTLPGAHLEPTIWVSPTFATDGLAFAWAGNHLYRSSDGGTTFVEVSGVKSTRTITGQAGGPLYLGSADATSSGGGLLASGDGGRTWQQLGVGTPLTQGVRAVTVLPSGAIVASPASGGVQCSTDGGRTWGNRCAGG